MEDLKKYYEVLGIGPGASYDEIKQAYRDLVNVWHPDRFHGKPRLQDKAQEKLKEFNEAYEEITTYFQRYGEPKFSYQETDGERWRQEERTNEEGFRADEGPRRDKEHHGDEEYSQDKEGRNNAECKRSRWITSLLVTKRKAFFAATTMLVVIAAYQYKVKPTAPLTMANPYDQFDNRTAPVSPYGGTFFDPDDEDTGNPFDAVYNQGTGSPFDQIYNNGISNGFHPNDPDSPSPTRAPP